MQKNHRQILASNPKISSWVQASAGTGKTKILTDRLLRLLMNNVNLKKILCLTFTNIAAEEMKERILLSLQKWSKLSKDELREELVKLGINDITEAIIIRAKNLYYSYLNNNEKINILTIHAFCFKLLKQFSLESGIKPQAKIITNIESKKILLEIKQSLFKSDKLNLIYKYLLKHNHTLIIDEMINNIIETNDIYRNNIHGNKEINIENEIKQIKEIINRLDNEDDFNDEYIKIFNKQQIKKYFFNSDFTNENNIVTKIKITLKKIFLTQKGEKRKKIISSKILSHDSSDYLQLEKLQDEIYNITKEEHKIHVKLYSRLINIFICEIMQIYEQYKHKNALIDYNDIIFYTHKLLTKSEARQWILYKLDGGIDHLLVDEAQDTSKIQWEIIDSLIEEFHSSENNNRRSIFVVGDSKQSIFSFQGADINAFENMQKYISDKLTNSKNIFQNITLDTSYRSTNIILNFVDIIFNDIYQKYNKLFHIKINLLNSFRSNLMKNTDQSNIHDSSKDLSKNSIVELWTEELSEEEIANNIVSYINYHLNRDQDTNLSDFMILFRKRSSLTNKIITALEQNHIKISGLDRIKLLDNKAIKDILLIMKFIFNPYDDLNLASLLKSPLFDLNDNELQDILFQSKLNLKSNSNIACKRLWNFLQKNQKNYQKIYVILRDLLDIYKQNNSASDFLKYISFKCGYQNLLCYIHGESAIDMINEIIFLAEDFEKEHLASMSEFLLWFENFDSDIKKEFNSVDQVRIMTIHGSKGLQAKYVILADAIQIPQNISKLITNNKGEIISYNKSEYITEDIKYLKSLHEEKILAEYMRLLYVALTRAKDHLVITGVLDNKKISNLSWFRLIKDALTLNEDKIISTKRAIYFLDKNLDKNNDINLMIDEYEHQIKNIASNLSSQTEQNQNIEIGSIDKEYLLQDFNNYIANISNKTDNDIDDNDDNLDEEINIDMINYQQYRNELLSNKEIYLFPHQTKSSKTEYGIICHKILEDAIKSNNLDQILNHPMINQLDEQGQKHIINNFNKIINNNEFREIININNDVNSKDSQQDKEILTEISIGKNEENHIINKRIDLLVKTANKIIIIDYKSDILTNSKNRNYDKYMEQLDIYQLLIKDIYKSYSQDQIKKAILWIETGELIFY